MKIEFTFKVDDILNLIGSNINTSQILISIDRSGPRQIYKATAVTPISSNIARLAGIGAEPSGTDVITGCPYPPGCTDQIY